MNIKRAVIFVLIVAVLAIGPFAVSQVNAAPEEVCNPAAFLPGGKVFSIGACINKAISIIGELILRFFGFILGLAGLVLNQVINFTVVDLAVNIRNITAINIAWSVIRDIVNMVFIFILLYIAIGTILGVGSINWKKNLINIIIAALFINFSLFFTRVMIDGSNIVALAFYDKIAPAGREGGGGLSDSFTQPLKITTLYKPSGTSALAETGNLITITLMGSIFLIIATVVFLAVAIMFLIRYVNIIFLLILSPFGFFGSILPGIGGQAKKWWSTFVGELVFAPVYMILTWVTLTILNDPAFLGGRTGAGTAALADAVKKSGSGALPDVGGISLVMNFVIVIIFLVATLIISKQVSGQSGSVGAKIVGAGLGGVAGASAWAGRRTVGAAARSVADSEKLKEKASEKGLGGMAARLALRSSQATASGNMDIRGGLAKTAGALGLEKELDLGIGKAGGKGGYDEYLKKKTEKEVKFGESLKPSDYAISEAKQKAEEAKRADVSSAPFKQKQGIAIEMRRRQMSYHDSNVKQLEAELAARRSTLSMAEVASYRSRIEEAQRKRKDTERSLNTALDPLKYKEELVKEAQSEAVRLEGLEGKKNIDKLNNQTIERIARERRVGKEEAKAAAEREGLIFSETKGAAKKRAEGYAEVITSNEVSSANQIPFIGNQYPFLRMVKKSHRQAAAKLKKGGKSTADKIKDMLKDEVKGDLEESEETVPAPGPDSGAPSAPAGPAIT